MHPQVNSACSRVDGGYIQLNKVEPSKLLRPHPGLAIRYRVLEQLVKLSKCVPENRGCHSCPQLVYMLRDMNL